MTKLFDVILIETRNTCTRKCWFCKFGQDRQDKAIVQMDWQTVERIVYNLKDLKYSGRISWFWINEPLMEKRIFEILKLTKKHCPRAFLSLTTNGDPLNVALYRDLRKSGLDALGVSIYDDKTLDKIKRMKKDDRVVTIDMRNPTPRGLENRAGSIKQNSHVFENNQRRLLNKSCERPFRMMTVNPKGQVVLCCADMYSDVVMGDIYKERLEEIWNNEMFHHYRKTLVEQGRKNLKLCDGCSYVGKSSRTFAPLLSRPRYDYFGVVVNTMRSMLGLDKG